MGRFRATIGAACATVLLSAGVAGAQGIVPDRTTFVTISAPVSLPGVVLPAGTYLFRLADTLASRNVVQIYDRDRSKIFATLITVAAERNEPSGDAVITFRESPADQAPALRYWYYAGEKGGHEFVYPKDQAVQIAQRSGESVLAVDTASSDIEGMKTADITRVEGAEAAETARRDDATAESDTAARSETAESQSATAQSTTAQTGAAGATAPSQMPPQSDTTTARAQTPGTGQDRFPTASRETMPRATGTSGSESAQTSSAATSGTRAPRELPRTAGEMPLVGLFGCLALGAAFGVRALRRWVLV